MVGLFFCFFVHAGEYPWVWMGKDDIQVTEHTRVEAEIRLEMTRRAQFSIDVVTFDQRADHQIGFPLIQALESAAKRGVKVRVATAWLAPFLKDPLFQASRYLKNAAKNNPNLEYLEVGGSVMRNRGWGYIDGVHEKLFIVDKKWLIVTGRGHAGEYIKWLDTAFLIKGPLVDQSQDVFDKLWKMVKRELEIKDVGTDQLLPVTQSTPIVPSKLGFVLSLNPKEQGEFQKYLTWLDQPPSAEKDYRGRTLHFNFLEQLSHQELTPGEYSYDERAEVLNDPVQKRAIALLKTTQKFHLSILAMTLDGRFRDALIEAIQRGMDTEILTNSSTSHASISPLRISPGWYAGLKTLDMVLMYKDADEVLKVYPNVQVHGLMERNDDPDSTKFLHRKLAIFDDTVIFGSHNLTISSTLTQDEVSYEIQSPEFAHQMKELSQGSIRSNAEPLHPLEVHNALTSTGYRQWMSSFFEKFYLEEQ
jgi:putative cardiolipin synthase